MESGQLTCLRIWFAGVNWLRRRRVDTRVGSPVAEGMWVRVRSPVWVWSCCWIAVSGQMIKCHKSRVVFNTKTGKEPNTYGSIRSDRGRDFRSTVLSNQVIVMISNLHIVVTVSIRWQRLNIKSCEIEIDRVPPWYCNAPITWYALWVVPRKTGAVNYASGGSRDNWWTTWKNIVRLIGSVTGGTPATILNCSLGLLSMFLPDVCLMLAKPRGFLENLVMQFCLGKEHRYLHLNLDFNIC